MLKGRFKVKSFDELGFSDDFMFGKTMEDKELCHDVLECLLQQPVGELEDVVSQREFKYTSDGKPMRLDIYTKDSDTVYDAEMQNLNKKKVEWHALPRRSRFYQASIDMDYLDKGDSYRTLPNSSVLFICTFDPFGKGLSQYTFRERCDEDSGILLGDGTVKHFYNCLYDKTDIPEDISQLYDYVRTGRVSGKLTERIEDAVCKARKNEKWRSAYMKERTVLMDAREEGREEGREEERLNTEVERERADNERKRADAAEARVRELEALLAATT